MSTDVKGIAIPNERVWSKWRRHREGTNGSGTAPRSLEQLFKQVEKSTQVRRTGLDQVLAELEMHRDATPDPDGAVRARLAVQLAIAVREPTRARRTPRQLVMATGTARGACTPR